MPEVPVKVQSSRTPAGKAAIIALLFPALVAFEGMSHVAKHEAADPSGVITVCNGITNYDLPTIKAGQKFTDAECLKLLQIALPKYFDEMNACVKVDLPPHRAAAFLDFFYNEGAKNGCHSDMVKLVNAGQTKDACYAFTKNHKYDIANHKHLPGLQKRRTWEQNQCLLELQNAPPATVMLPPQKPVVMQPAEPWYLRMYHYLMRT